MLTGFWKSKNFDAYFVKYSCLLIMNEKSTSLGIQIELLTCMEKNELIINGFSISITLQ